MIRRLFVAALGFAAAVPAVGQASSPDAWAAFRADVRARCLAAGQAQGMKAPRVIVHPDGSPAYGIAVLIEGDDKRICVYVKQTKAVELTPAT